MNNELRNKAETLYRFIRNARDKYRNSECFSRSDMIYCCITHNTYKIYRHKASIDEISGDCPMGRDNSDCVVLSEGWDCSDLYASICLLEFLLGKELDGDVKNE